MHEKLLEGRPARGDPLLYEATEGHLPYGLEGMCFCKIRWVPMWLRDELHRRGLWEDLRQELRVAAWEAWQQGLGEKEIYRLADRRLRAFLKANGYYFYQRRFYSPERSFSSITDDLEVLEKVLSRGTPVSSAHTAAPAFIRDHDCLDQAILALLKRKGGLGKPEVCRRLNISIQELHWRCAPLIKQGLVVEVRRENGRGRPLTPLLVTLEPGQEPPPMMRTEKMERIRQAYLEGKSIEQIRVELHHHRKTVKRALQAGGIQIRGCGRRKQQLVAA